MFTNLLFDLDNTLYSASSHIDEKVTFRAINSVAVHLGISYDQACEIRAKNAVPYGTTLEWLRAEHGFTDEATEKYFAYIHPENETDDVIFDPNLRPFLQSLDMPMAVLTNSPMEHASRILKFLSIEDLFVHIFDIRASGISGKPNPAAYKKALENSGFTLESTLFFDDYPKYAQGYANIGGTTVLIDEQNKHTDSTLLRIKSIYEIPELLKQLEKTAPLMV